VLGVGALLQRNIPVRRNAVLTRIRRKHDRMLLFAIRPSLHAIPIPARCVPRGLRAGPVCRNRRTRRQVRAIRCMRLHRAPCMAASGDVRWKPFAAARPTRPRAGNRRMSWPPERSSRNALAGHARP
jgi:hypothetical protein